MYRLSVEGTGSILLKCKLGFSCVWSKTGWWQREAQWWCFIGPEREEVCWSTPASSFPSTPALPTCQLLSQRWEEPKKKLKRLLQGPLLSGCVFLMPRSLKILWSIFLYYTPLNRKRGHSMRKPGGKELHQALHISTGSTTVGSFGFVSYGCFGFLVHWLCSHWPCSKLHPAAENTEKATDTTCPSTNRDMQAYSGFVSTFDM